MNKINYIFAIFSLICSSSICGFILPGLFEKNDTISKLFKLGYSQIYQSLPYPKITYIIFIGILLFLIIWCTLEIFWDYVDENPLTSRGSAHWATKNDIKDLIKSTGVPVGKIGGKIIRINETHLVTCAGTRSGKGIGAIIPTLLEYPDSLVCLDIKGENYAVSGTRRKEFGNVFTLNPFGVLDIPSNSYNWLDSINLNNPECTDKALKIASLLIGETSNNNIDSHFNEQAKRLLQGIILFVCNESSDKRNIITVSDIIHRVPINDLCQAMINNGDLAFGVVGNIGVQFLNNTNDKELSGILSTAQRATNFLDNPRIKETLIKSDFDILKLPDQKISIYLIMPADKVSDFQAYIKIFFELAFLSLTSRKTRGKHNVLFLLDEVAQLGYMESFSKLITLLKGMGGQFWFFFQSIAQLQAIYGKHADTILGNSTQIFYGCNDITTAKLISDNLGKKTIREYKKNGDYIDSPRDLLSPDEIRKLSPEKPIILMSSRPPIQVKRLNYLKDKEYKNKFNNNPYF